MSSIKNSSEFDILNTDITLRVLKIVAGTSVDGPGLRTSIYFAGCRHHCPGCHNPESWDMDGGTPMTIDEIISEVEKEGFNVTFTGGDPIYQLAALTQLAQCLKDRGYTIWLYTGFTIEELGAVNGFSELAQNLEAIVDGPFVESLRDTSLLFRGSSNQRILHPPF